MEDVVLHSILNGTHSYLITYTTVRNFEKSRVSSDWLQQHCMYGGDPHFALPIVNSHRNSVKLKAIYLSASYTTYRNMLYGELVSFMKCVW